MDIEIIIPSRGRAGKVLTNVSGQKLLVAESELSDYRNAYPEIEILTHPNLKNLSSIRQFIIEKFQDVFMLDDDIVYAQINYKSSGYRISPEKAAEIIQRTYWQAKLIGAHLFGFNNSPTPKHYNQHKPYSLKGYINASAFGIIRSDKLYFDKRTTACESHWINLLNAYHHRYCFIDRRFHFRQATNSTFNLIGGQTGKRTMQSEKFDTLFLKMIFGDSVKIKKQAVETNQLHIYQRQIKIEL